MNGGLDVVMGYDVQAMALVQDFKPRLVAAMVVKSVRVMKVKPGS